MSPTADQSTNFDWMDNIGEAFSPFLDQSMTPFDFGASGYTACTNIGGEILEITAPSDLCGYVSVKGGFDDSMDSLLARAQRPFGGRATFSLKIEAPQKPDAPASDPPPPPPPPRGKAKPTCRLGALKERGSLNHRWPLTRYWLDMDIENDDGNVSPRVGDCTVVSFVRQQTVFQVMRLQLFNGDLGDGASPRSRPHVVNPNHVDTHVKDSKPREATVHLRLGGPVRFSCRCSGLVHRHPDMD